MNWFNRMKIGSKVALASGLGIALVLTMVVVSFVMLQGVQQAVDRAADQSTIARLLTAVNTDLQLMRVASRDIRLAKDPAKIAEFKANSDTAWAEAEQ